ncbi:MAG: RecQ family ATP-dependent DNA helicase, partial [Deltaproteobacteria bacterium]|nr:RecQ family ATP-dependent DNA helicase [Deltaproteobacteria bacterium]
TELGVSAVCLNSSISQEEYKKNIRLIKQNRAKLLYVSPETLLKPGILDLLSSVGVSCLAIDEAHCISEWGHDFRPEYRQLADVRSCLSGTVCIALTATATPRVRQDIINSLNFESSNEYISSFDRENLFIRIVSKTDPVDQTLSFISQFHDQSGIIYCFSRRQVEDLSEILEQKGFSVRPYHAGLPDEIRKKNQELFIKDDVLIMVATIAFGMGINKPNVRFVIHYDLPKNIESYYQEIGRSGRDGLRSECMMLFGYGDIQKIKYFINQKPTREKRVANVHLQALLKFAETDTCRRIPLLGYFGEECSKKSCGMCDNCLSGKKESKDITVYAQKFLSCVKRTGEIFGAAHVIDVLRGSESKKVLRFGHQHVSTYGIGKELTKKQWFHLSRQLLHQGLVIQDTEYGGLKLAENAWDVFKGKETVSGRIEADEIKIVKKPTENIADFDKKLFDRLREKRKQLADEAKVPPYVIFSDRTLIEMSAFFPQNINNMKNIYGIGEEKLKKYGFIFLEVICEYCEKHGIAERLKENGQLKRKTSKQPRKLRHVAIGEAYNAGESIEKIMARYNIKLVTVLDHLFKYVVEGNKIRSDGLLSVSALSQKKIQAVLETFDRLGTEYLSPIYKKNKGKISYEDLKIIRLYDLSKKSSKNI